MRGLAEYVMRGRKQAIWVALLFTFIPLMGWIGDAIIALITLRKGPKEGAIVLLWVLLPAVVVAIKGYPQVWLYSVLGGSVAVYCFAIILRTRNSWALVLQVGMLAGVVTVIALRWWTPEFGVDLVKDLQAYIQGAGQRLGMPITSLAGASFITALMKVAIGLQIALLLLSDLFSLFFARWWQALLYNPKGLAAELWNVRLGWESAGLLMLAVVLSLAGVGFAVDSMPVIALPFLLAGLSLSHYLVAAHRASKLWLAGLYCLLALLFLYVAVLLILVALADIVVNARQRFRIT